MENALIATIVVTITSIALLLSRDWRICLLILAAQYVGVFFLISTSWPILVAIIVLISGWISCIVLVMAKLSAPDTVQLVEFDRLMGRKDIRYLVASFLQLLNERAFYIFAALLLIGVIGSQLPRVMMIFPSITPEHAWSCLVMIGFGLLGIGFSDRPLQVTLGILTFLSGFEILYAIIQSSLLMAGLLSGITLALSLAGAYWMLSRFMESSN